MTADRRPRRSCASWPTSTAERDGTEQRLIAGCFGIFGHGNVAGVGQALLEAELAGEPDLPYLLARNEQAMVHAAAGYARHAQPPVDARVHVVDRPGRDEHGHRRGAGHDQPPARAAAARRHLRHARREPGAAGARGPGLATTSRSTTAFRPVSRFLDRINRPEQLPAEPAGGDARAHRPGRHRARSRSRSPRTCRPRPSTGPSELFERRVWRVRRPPAEPEALAEAAELLRGARRPLDRLRRRHDLRRGDRRARRAGRGERASRWPRRRPARARCPTTTRARSGRSARPARRPPTRSRARPTSCSASARAGATSRPPRAALFADPEVRFVNLNVAPVDAFKQAGAAARRRRARRARGAAPALEGWAADADHSARAARAGRRVGRRPSSAPTRSATARCPPRARSSAPSTASASRATSSSAPPGSMPGDLHKLWRTRDPKGYHVEYGYSCMGYEIAGGLGVKMADPDREVFVHGRRRLLPDDGPGARHRRPGGRQADDRPRAEPRLRVDRRAVGVARLAALRHPLPPPQPRDRRAGRRAACPSTSPPTRPSLGADVRSRDDAWPSSRRRCATARAAERDDGRRTSRPTRSSPRRAPRPGGTSPSPRSPAWSSTRAARDRLRAAQARPAHVPEHPRESEDPVSTTALRTVQHVIGGQETAGASTRTRRSGTRRPASSRRRSCSPRPATSTPRCRRARPRSRPGATCRSRAARG